MIQVFVSERAGPEEEDLKLFRLRNEFSVWTIFFWLAFYWFWNLIQLVCTVGDGISSFELLSINGIPVKEEVDDRTVVFCEVSN